MRWADEEPREVSMTEALSLTLVATVCAGLGLAVIKAVYSIITGGVQ